MSRHTKWCDWVSDFLKNIDIEGKIKGKRGWRRPRRSYSDEIREKDNVVFYQEINVKELNREGKRLPTKARLLNKKKSCRKESIKLFTLSTASLKIFCSIQITRHELASSSASLDLTLHNVLVSHCSVDLKRLLHYSLFITSTCQFPERTTSIQWTKYPERSHYYTLQSLGHLGKKRPCHCDANNVT